MKVVVIILVLLAGTVYGQRRNAGYYLGQSRAELAQNRIATAEQFADSALLQARQSNNLDSLMIAYLLLYEVHAIKKDYQNAIIDFRMASVYRDSISQQRKTSELMDLRDSLQTERDFRLKEVADLQNEILGLREAAERDRFNMLPIIGGLVILLGLAVIMIYREKHRLLSALKQSEEDIRQLRAFKDKLFTVLSYDLRTSLSAFENLTQGTTVRLDTMNKEDSVQFLDKIHETAGELKSTLNNIIFWVAVQANAKPFRPSNFDCKMLAGQILEKSRPQIIERKLTAEVFMPDNQEVFADREMVAIILENLFSNAVHFTPPGGAITCFSGSKDGLVTVGVKDTGVGISKEDIDKLFKADVDVHSIGKASHKGAGVGLILSKELVERNGGRMYVESTTGQGSTFYFTLPEKKFV